VDESMSDSYFYSKDKSKIYYKNIKSLDFSKSWNYEWEEVPANAKFFKVMEGGFGKDGKHIFFGSKIIKNVDYDTFRKVEDSDNFIDKNNFFVGDKIIPNINPEEVIFDTKNNKISYRGKVWNWQTEAFDVVEKK
jgi:hypothetical protein